MEDTQPKKTKYDISIVLITYNPQEQELIYTLNSLILQDNVNFEIIVADDGSETDPSDFIDQYFKTKDFSDYIIVRNDHNIGTVNNILSGAKIASGDYIKAISPGDFLYSCGILHKWLLHIKEKNSQVSFGDVVCYTNDQGKFIPIKRYARPQNISLYQKGKINAIKKNHLLFGDAANGAAIIAEKELYIQYLTKIAGRVRYCEDMSFDLMILNDIIPTYFPYPVVLYEVGTGISTSGESKWRERLASDRKEMTKIILENCTDQRFERKYKAAIGAKWTTNKSDLLKKYLENPEIILKRLKLLFYTRQTDIVIDQEFVIKIQSC